MVYNLDKKVDYANLINISNHYFISQNMKNNFRNGRKIIKKKENKLKYPLHDSTSIIEVKLATISNKEMSPRT